MVLNDHTGLHLGAGPLLLFYDRAPSTDLGRLVDQQATYPRIVKVLNYLPRYVVTVLKICIQDLVQQDNMAFLSGLPLEIASLYSGPVKLDDEPSLEGYSSEDVTVQGQPESDSEPMVEARVVEET